MFHQKMTVTMLDCNFQEEHWSILVCNKSTYIQWSWRCLAFSFNYFIQLCHYSLSDWKGICEEPSPTCIGQLKNWLVLLSQKWWW